MTWLLIGVGFGLSTYGAVTETSRFWVIFDAAVAGYAVSLALLGLLLWLAEMKERAEQPAPAPPAGRWEEMLDDHTPPPQVTIEDDGDPWRWVPYGTAGEVHHGCLSGWSCTHCRGVIAKVHAQ